LLTVHHIGYLVKKIEHAERQFEELGYVVERERHYDDIRKVDITFLTKDSYRVELVSPVAPDSVVSGLIKRYKNAPYHICYAVDNLEANLEKLGSQGFVQITKVQPAPAIDGRRVVFLQNAAIGMIELVESEEEN
jgi:methylmalonyl-CoA/ethylmalonyl-CoA epimerase